MKVNRHGKPSNAYLKTLREPKRADYQVLVNAALEAIIEGENDVLIAFPYVLKYPADFPKGILVEKVEDRNIRKVKARKLLKWLNDNGHTPITSESLRGAMISNGLAFAAFDEKCEFPVAPGFDFDYNSVSTATVGTELEQTGS